MNTRSSLFTIALGVLIGSSAGAAAPVAVARHHPPPPTDVDPVLRWNEIALGAVAEDHSATFGPAEQGGPTRAARALAIVHAAIYDAVNSIDGSSTPYLIRVPVGRHDEASVEAAVATAGHDTLATLYPAQTAVFDAALRTDLDQISHGSRVAHGTVVGRSAAHRILAARRRDGADAEVSYTPGLDPGDHREDPINPAQGFLTPHWGAVTPFVIESAAAFRSPPPPNLASREYAEAFDEVNRLGGDGAITATDRTAEQTEIGLYWAYDGAKGLGPPPRLYNQITRVIAEDMGNTVVENARLFALVNLALADAGIACWETKYVYDFWRPILGIRESDPGTGPSGRGDGNPSTIGDTEWTPLCAPASNQKNAKNFTPPFPAYPSGHATFGAAMFRIIERFYGTDDIPFTFVSDELNGITTDNHGVARPLAPRSFTRLRDATLENALSRIYLGIHWQFDATAGIDMGVAIADHVYATALVPVD
jgi:hypothetical protein